ncbi:MULTISPECIES: endolytic transglycosylase MltG [Rhizobiaceae]|uniref:Endolytic murein transglycosylase n=1 Tax=Peteryoungia algae TaxID=2919917 RepID=A0ABT0D3Z1_9HYPH|nr:MULTISPECIES: endolytic transglycosylase MltG [unclassified Rhizobium]MCC8933729.1 endolytic transglycosylase MltG [Rhizobium sp. 'Codium 1']MCJ8240130.1 endolytic transglycosylase MltG [Rhizobium sp. SSM4.3]
MPVTDNSQNGGSQNNGVSFGRDADNQPGKGPFIPKSPNEALRPERVPQPPRRSRKARSQLVIFLNFLMTMAVFVCVVAVAGFFYVMDSYQKPGPLAANTNFVVRSGAGLAEIANNLERNGIVSDARIYRYVTTTYLADGQTLKAGEYEIKAGASMKEVTALLESGKSILYAVSFPEGLTVKQMFQRLAADTVLEGELPTELPPEGSLRPDTYKFTRGTNRAEIVTQMRAAQDRLIDQIWEKRDPDLPVETKEEFVTLASIVEKETGKDDERAHVASVFINRLNKGMRLQSDPTIIYGLFGGDGKPADRPIFQSDIRKETPYNTYVIKGLPPGPIANPGRAALESVAHPWKTEDLYFVADGNGGHAFAPTLDEHNANVRRWRKIEAERAQTPPATLDVEPEIDPAAND